MAAPGGTASTIIEARENAGSTTRCAGPCCTHCDNIMHDDSGGDINRDTANFTLRLCSQPALWFVDEYYARSRRKQGATDWSFVTKCFSTTRINNQLQNSGIGKTKSLG
jgi:hypothetical protein